MTRLILAASIALTVLAYAVAVRIIRDGILPFEDETDPYIEMVPMTWSVPGAHTTVHRTIH